MATRIKSSQIADGAIVAADLHSAIAINTTSTIETTSSGTFGSVIVDNYTLGSNKISTNQANSYNGDIMLDAAGKIILDTDAGNVQFKDDGQTYAEIERSSGNVILYGAEQDKTIEFKGNVSGTATTGLTLDFANSGRATFNENVIINGNLQVDGTQTILNTATLSVEDLNITVASGASTNAEADGAGITVGGSSATILYDGTNDEWDFNKDVVVSGELTSTGQLSVDHTGDMSGALKLGDPSTIASETGIYLRTSTIGHFAIPNTGTFRFRDTTPLTYLDIQGTGDIKFYESNSGSPQVGMHWDYLQGRLGIGSTDPSSPLTVAIDSGHTDPASNITSSHKSAIDIYNPLEANTNDKGSIITFSDNYYDATNNNYPKSTRAGIKGSTDEIGNNASGYLSFYTNNTSANNLIERMRITSAGNVGIGINNPVSTLDVRSTNSVGSVFRKDFNGPVADTFSKVAVTLWGQDHDDADVGTGTDQFGPMLGFGARIDDGNPNSSDIRAGISYSYNGDLTFHAKAGVSVADGSYERIRIDGATGNVGIGAKVPSENLDIQSGDVDDHVHVVIGPSAVHSTDKESHLQLWRTNSSQARTKVGELRTDIPLPAEGTRGTSLWSYQTLRLVTANSSAGHIVFAPKGTVRMRIDDAGNVGVGSVFTTTAPPDKQFHVKGAGDIKIEDDAGGSAHLHITSSTNGLKNSEWRLKTSGSNDEFYIDHMYTDNDGTSDVAVTNGQSFKITGDTHNIYNSNSQVDVRPVLNLDFANSKTLHKDIVFYRDSYATYYDKNGNLRIADRNQPRFDHDPFTGESKGLLIEEATANYTDHANNFNSWYGQNRVMVVANAAMSPSGKMDASYIVDKPDGTNLRKELWRGYPMVNGATYTFSFYAKAGEKDKIAVVWYGDNGVFGGDPTIFNVANGTVHSSGFADIAVMQPLRNGWYRCIGQVTANATAAGYYGFYMIDNSSSSGSYIGSTGNGVYVYGAQFENRNYATSYIPNLDTFTSRSSSATYQDENGLLRTATVNEERHGYFWSDKKQRYIDGGLTKENSSTNLLYNTGGVSSDLYGDLLTFEAKWTITDSSRDVTAPDGSPFTTKGATGSSGNHWYWQISPVVYTVGTAYTHSCWVRCADGQTGTVTMNAYPQAGHSGIVTITDRWQRVQCTFDMTAGLGNPYVGFVSPSDNSTFYFWGWQVEQQPKATSYISTQGAATTRAADSFGSSPVTRPLEHARIDNLDKADWFDEDRASVLVDFDSTDKMADDVVVVSITDKDLNNGHRIPWLTSNTTIRGAYWAGTQYGIAHYYNDVSSDADNRWAISWDKDAGKYATALNGDAHAETSDWSVFSTVKANQINIGGNYSSDRPFTGHIKKVAIWNEDLTRVQLQALTEND